MSKSKYPKKIDSSVELPIVRDNIIQIGSEAINSLRSAIINIEKTLGVMPNGYDAGTVADRLNKSLDELGNLKASAISALNLLSGPIKNKDVQENARIEESKLDLDFSTNTLYAQSESLRKDLENIIGTVNELSLLLSIHLNPDANGSHKAKNISVEEIQENGSDTTDLSKGVQNLQLILDELINKHINYSGSGISEDNNSHEANQIFYDNINTSLQSSSVQEAIDEISNLNFNIGDQLKDDFFSNGYLKTISKNTGKAISEPLEVTYYVYSGISDSAISTINYSGIINETPETFDIIRIGESDYQIHSIDTVLKTIKIYGVFSSDSGSGVLGVIYRNEHKKSNPAAFKMMPVFNSDGLKTKAIKFVNPDSTYVISDVLSLGNITSGANIKVKIDSLLEHTFTFSSSDSEINNLIDTISKDISVNNLPISAFRVDTEKGTRLGLALDLVNSSNKIYYINISGSNENLSFLGLQSINGIDVHGSFGSSFLVNGLQYSSLNKKFSTTGLNIIDSSEVIQNAGSGVNFIERKVKENDILVIAGSSSSDGAYLIKSVTETELEVDSSILLASNTNEAAVFQVIESSIGLDQISFENVTTAGFETAVVEVFLDSNRNISYKTVAEYSNTLDGVNSDFLFSIVNMEDEYEDKTYEYEISLIDTLDSTQGFKFIFDEIEYLIKRDSGSYELEVYTSDTKKISFYFPDIDALMTLMPINSSVFTNKTINPTQNFILGKFRFDKYRNLASKYTESFESMGGLMVGHISDLDVSEKFKKDNIELTTKELRSNGCVLGAKVTNEPLDPADVNYSFTVESGIVYIKGKRFKIPKQKIDTNLALATNTKIFIALDQKGNVVCDGAGSSACVCPFDTENYLILATIEYNGSSLFNYDLRLFINSLDEKVLNHITVSPQDGMGHFSDIGSALRYAKRFSEVYNNAGIPKIILKSGTFRQTIEHSTSSALFLNKDSLTKIATDGILIDFPVIIEGEGESTVLDLTNLWSDTLTSDKATELNNRGGIYILGNSIQAPDLPIHPNASALSRDVIIKNLKLKNSRIYVIDQYHRYNAKFKRNKITLENITFESDTTFDQGALYFHYNGNTFDTENMIGSISVSNCFFSKSGSLLTSLNNSSYVRDFSFINNIYESLSLNAPLFLESDTVTDLSSLTTEEDFFTFFGNATTRIIKNPSDELLAANFNKIGTASGKENFYEVNSKFINAEEVTITGNLNYSGSSTSSFTDITTTNLIAGTADINSLSVNSITGSVTVEDIEVTGEITGNVISTRYLSFAGGSTQTLFLATIDGSSAADTGFLSLFSSYGGIKTVFANATPTVLKKIVFRNHGSATLLGAEVLLFKLIPSADSSDFNDYNFLTPAYAAPIGTDFGVLGPPIFPSGGVQLTNSSFQSYAIVLRLPSPPGSPVSLSAEAIFVKEV